MNDFVSWYVKRSDYAPRDEWTEILNTGGVETMDEAVEWFANDGDTSDGDRLWCAERFADGTEGEWIEYACESRTTIECYRREP